jgi:hypothetical protein
MKEEFNGKPNGLLRLRIAFSFILSELRELLYAFINMFWKSTVITSILLFILLEILIWNSEPSPASSEKLEKVNSILQLLVVMGMALFYSLPVGVIAGVTRVVWRLCGVWILFPLIVVPLSLVLSFWLFNNWLHSEALNVVQALKVSAHTNGLEYTSNALGGGVGVHAGPLALILLIFLLPFMLADLFFILIDLTFLQQFFWFLLCFFSVVAVGTIPSSLMSVSVLCITFINRLYGRYHSFIENYNQVRSFQ